MLTSHKQLINLIKTIPIEQVLQIGNEADKEDIKRPSMQIVEEEQAIVFYCSLKLFEYIKTLKEKNLKELSMLDIARIYKEMKPFLMPVD